MKSLQRTRAGSIVRSALFVTAAVGVMGVSYGAISVEHGLPWWIPVLLSVLVVAGTSELMFVTIIASGASSWLAAAAGLLVNARHLPFGFQAAPLLGHGVRALAAARRRSRRISAPVCRSKAQLGASIRSAVRACAPWRLPRSM